MFHVQCSMLIVKRRMKLKTVIEKTRVVKQTAAKVQAWDNGRLREVYFNGPVLHGSAAKYFIRNRQADTVKVVAGRVYQDAEGKPYFLTG